MEELNIRLKAQRQRSGKTQAQIAEVLSVSKSHYANMESGDRSISLQYLTKLCRFYNVSADYFLGFDDYPYPLGDNSDVNRVTPDFYVLDGSEQLTFNEMISVYYRSKHRGED